MNGITRRELVRRAGGAALVLGAGAAPAIATAGAEAHAPRELARRLRGPLVLRGERGYRAAKELVNTRFDTARPLAIAYCEDARDVRTCVSWAACHGIRLRARSGGHSGAGYSTGPGLIVDVSRIRAVRVDAVTGRARVGAGALNIDLDAALAPHGVTIPTGTCPTVGVAGLTLGGGFGTSSRELGLCIDNLRELELVTARGRLVRASRDERPDLFWGCRGGGGGNFGMATAFTFRTHRVGPVAIYQLSWAWESAREVVRTWHHWLPQMPDALFSSLELSSAGGRGEPFARSVSCSGRYHGSEDALRQLFGPLLSIAGRAGTRIATMSWFDAQRLEAGCEEDTVEQCHFPTQAPGGKLRRFAADNKNNLGNRPLRGPGVETVLAWIERWPGASPPGAGAVQFESLGGAINRVPAAATAWVHRDSTFLCQYKASWAAHDPPATARAGQAWVRDFHAAMRPHISPAAYQNVIDPDLRDWERAYYGANYPRLARIKAKYDPSEVFRFRQSIRPAQPRAVAQVAS